MYRALSYRDNIQNFKDLFSKQIELKSEMIPMLKEKAEKLRGKSFSNEDKARLLKKQRALSQIVDDRDRELEESREKYEGYIQKLKDLFHTGELALSNVYSFKLPNRITRKENNIKALYKEISTIKQEVSSLRQRVLEQKRERNIEEDKHELELKEVKEDLEEAHDLINIMGLNKDKLLIAISDRNKELEQKDALIKKIESEAMEKIEELSRRLKKKDNSKTFSWITVIFVLVAAVIIAIIMKY